jgi:hypothetical protein
VSFIENQQNGGVAIPMLRSLRIPGPARSSHELQPYGQIVQLDSGELNLETNGTDDGWLNGSWPRASCLTWKERPNA